MIDSFGVRTPAKWFRGECQCGGNFTGVRLGFRPIPVEKIGPHADPLRASWPIVEVPGVRETGLPIP